MQIASPTGSILFRPLEKAETIFVKVQESSPHTPDLSWPLFWVQAIGVVVTACATIAAVLAYRASLRQLRLLQSDTTARVVQRAAAFREALDAAFGRLTSGRFLEADALSRRHPVEEFLRLKSYCNIIPLGDLSFLQTAARTLGDETVKLFDTLVRNHDDLADSIAQLRPHEPPDGTTDPAEIRAFRQRVEHMEAYSRLPNLVVEFFTTSRRLREHLESMK